MFGSAAVAEAGRALHANIVAYHWRSPGRHLWVGCGGHHAGHSRCAGCWVEGCAGDRGAPAGAQKASQVRCHGGSCGGGAFGAARDGEVWGGGGCHAGDGEGRMR
eukprot:2637974-Prymnesium_polylepis.1